MSSLHQKGKKRRRMSSIQQSDSCLQLVKSTGLAAAAKGSNFIFSPVSIRVVLSLAAAGSKGDRLEQFLSFLGSETITDLNSTAAGILDLCSKGVRTNFGGGYHRDGYNLSFANGVWVDHAHPLNPSFAEIATSVYQAVANSVDFQNEAPRVGEEINNWVEERTNGRIKNFISRDTFKHFTKIVLVNAVYFKGLWFKPFKKNYTRDKEFHLLNGNSIQVPFMTSGSGSKQCISSFDGFQVLRLPYQRDEEQRSFSMLIFLPSKKDGLSYLIEKVVDDPNFFNQHVPYNAVEVGEFFIPKFKISYEFDVSKSLKKLGVVLPFTFSEALLNLQTESEIVSKVLHKAVIEVTEEGTIAAAVTKVVGLASCCRHRKPPPRVNFVADHPFIFAIREEKTGVVLFYGHVANPSVAN